MAYNDRDHADVSRANAELEELQHPGLQLEARRTATGHRVHAAAAGEELTLCGENPTEHEHVDRISCGRCIAMHTYREVRR